MSETKVKRVQILGQPLDCVTMAQTLELIRAYLRSNNSNLILTADSNAFVNAETDPRFQRIFQEASLVVPDSAGPVWALGVSGNSVPDRVSGVELVREVCQISEELGSRIFFFGSAPGVAAKAAENLKSQYPQMTIAGVRDGFFPQEKESEVASEIAATHPDILLVALGMPKQELFILDHASTIGAKVGIGVGGSFDVHSGMVKRAPKVIQQVRMEWLWRLILNPRKFDKVKNLPLFYWKVRKSFRK